MILLSGTVRNSVKLAQLDSKWQQKKKENNIFKKDIDPQMWQIEQYKEDLAKMRESNKMAEITAKMKSGESLTAEEIDYLKKNNPSAYQAYEEIRQEKENYEKQLKNCKTKDEVEKLKVQKLGQFAAEAKKIANDPCIPESKKVQLMGKILGKTMGVQKVHMAFVESAKYQALPTEEELAREREEKAEALNDAENAEVIECADESESTEKSEMTDESQSLADTEEANGLKRADSSERFGKTENADLAKQSETINQIPAQQSKISDWEKKSPQNGSLESTGATVEYLMQKIKEAVTK